MFSNSSSAYFVGERKVNHNHQIEIERKEQNKNEKKNLTMKMTVREKVIEKEMTRKNG